MTTLPPLSVSDGVATIRLGRPDAGNALDLPAATALRDAVTEIARTVRDIDVVVVRAEGRLFCVGGDVRAMAAAADRPAFVAELAGVLHDALVALRALPVPVVAVVQGTAAGAGIGCSSRPTSSSRPSTRPSWRPTRRWACRPTAA